MTEAVIILPHDPLGWLARGQTLKKLGYPDLASGDLYRSILLAEAVLDANSTDAIRRMSRLEFGLFLWDCDVAKWEGQTLEETHRYVSEKTTGILMEAYLLLFQCFHDIGATWDKVSICEQALHKIPRFPPGVKDSIIKIMGEVDKALRDHLTTTVRRVGGDSFRQIQALHQGLVYVRSWPWLTKAQLTRSEQLICNINDEFREHSGAIKVAGSNVREISDDGPNVLGVYATKDIRVGGRVLTDHTIIAACNRHSKDICSHCFRYITNHHDAGNNSDNSKPSDNSSRQHPTSQSCDKCSTQYCSSRCKEVARDNYHKVLCGKDFSWVHDRDYIDEDLQAGLLLRTLAICIQSGRHPLSHPLIARLTASDDRGDRSERWSFPGDIIVPMQILTQLGIDAFADQRYDTWVIRTIWSRLMINKAGAEETVGVRRSIVSVKPLMSFFNHSCEPQLSYHGLDGSSAIEIRACRDIRGGEELYLSYIGPCEDRPLWVRRHQLVPWFGGDCLCTRCVREEKEEREEEERMEREWEEEEERRKMERKARGEIEEEEEEEEEEEDLEEYLGSYV